MDNNPLQNPETKIPPQPEDAPHGAPEETGRTFTQAEVNRIVQERLAKERERTASRQPGPTDQELQIKAYSEQIADLKSDNEKYRLELARIEVAREFDLPQALVNRLQGNSLEELTDDARNLLSIINRTKPAQPAAPAFAGEPSGYYYDNSDVVRQSAFEELVSNLRND